MLPKRVDDHNWVGLNERPTANSPDKGLKHLFGDREIGHEGARVREGIQDLGIRRICSAARGRTDGEDLCFATGRVLNGDLRHLGDNVLCLRIANRDPLRGQLNIEKLLEELSEHKAEGLVMANVMCTANPEVYIGC